MKIINIFVISILIFSCSFDNKSGVWKTESDYNTQKKTIDQLQTLTSFNKLFEKTIPLRKNFSFEISQEINNSEWQDIFYNLNNNFDNFSFKNNGNLIFKSKKLSKYEIGDFILYENENVIINDKRGNILVYSILNVNFY